MVAAFLGSKHAFQSASLALDPEHEVGELFPEPCLATPTFAASGHHVLGNAAALGYGFVLIGLRPVFHGSVLSGSHK